jgi:hypothetical protein
MPGELAQQVFRMSQLPDEILARVWDLSAYDKRVPGALIASEWVVAMYLLEAARDGRVLPSWPDRERRATLPQELIASAEGATEVETEPKTEVDDEQRPAVSSGDVGEDNSNAGQQSPTAADAVAVDAAALAFAGEVTDM